MAGLYIPSIEICGPRGSECAVVYETMLAVWDDGRMTLEFVGGEDDLSFSVIPVPDHGRLIDADALSGCGKECYGCPYDSCALPEIVQGAPTVIPADEEGRP